MTEDDEHKYDRLPIPTYEEATSSRPESSQSFHGLNHGTTEVERQGLLGQAPLVRNMPSGTNYQPPRAESARDSYDTVTSLGMDSEEEEALRQDMEQMEVTDPDGERRAQQRVRMRSRLHKSFQTLSQTLSSLHLPAVRIPWLESIRERMPSLHFNSNSEYKPSWPIIARIVGLMILTGAVYSLVALKVFGSPRALMGQQYVPESIRSFVQGAVDRSKIEAYLREFSYDDHVAGTKGDFFLAQYVEDHFRSAGLSYVFHEDYYVYLNYPTADGRRVAIVEPPGLEWEAILEEDTVSPESDSHQTLAFHGHSKSNDVTGPLIYANYGSRSDFAWLSEHGVNLNGSIVLVRYYGTQRDRALKVKASELAGAAGCIIYSDPAEDGFVKGPVYPEGPWRTEDSVQRGAVSLTSWLIGDVLTPGWASTHDAERLAVDNTTGLVNIPSIPLSWRDAKVLLSSLQSQKAGQKAPNEWIGGIPEIEYWTGDGFSASPVVNLKNLQDEVEQQPVRNVIGRIDGYEDFQKQVYVGNHRDAWCFGSVDPGSGTAVFMEVVRIFGKLLELDWRPRRSIVFASWDGEEYNLIGSTEHVEDRLGSLRQYGLAYLNVDAGVAGETFEASGSPLFASAIWRVLDRVNIPNGNHTLRQQWNETGATLGSLGVGSDYVAFQNIAGISSLDFGFRGEPNSFPSHSCYESMHWMEMLGDPDFSYHEALAQIWVLLILEIADEPIVPYNFEQYAYDVDLYIQQLQEDANHEIDRWSAIYPENPKPILDFRSLYDAGKTFLKSSSAFMLWEENWRQEIIAHNGMESQTTSIRRVSHNSRMLEFETHLLDLPSEEEGRGEGGIPGREQYKHLIFGPQKWNGYDEANFPAIRDRVQENDWEGAQVWIDRVASILAHAAEKLVVGYPHKA